jgi:hypothetical protein
MELQQTTSHKVVLPFYYYAAACFVVACAMLLLHTGIFSAHYFHPHTLAITHLMALGWGTMIILGASYQLLPVLIEAKLDSLLLAKFSFWCTAAGIPLIVTGFYIFDVGLMLKTGGILVNAGIILYLVNVACSIYESKRYDVHAIFMLVASLWLFSTTFFGLLLVFNFTDQLFASDSVAYLSIHAHMGLAGWFLLMIVGVASRLIPMFLISKYTNKRLLWLIFALINTSLIAFIIFHLEGQTVMYYLPVAGIITAILCLIRFVYSAHKLRIRKRVDKQVSLSLLSVTGFLLPVLLLPFLVHAVEASSQSMVLLYGFICFFGWITAIILGMTFKTLPFIIWNKIYQSDTSPGTPTPADLFSEKLYRLMQAAYVTGFLFFIVGIISHSDVMLKGGATFLLLSALLYGSNVVKTSRHESKRRRAGSHKQ